MSDPLKSARFHQWRTILDAAASLSMIVCSIALVAFSLGRSPEASRAERPKAALPLPTEPISLDGGWMQGNQQAEAVLVEFSDFQCPFCGTFARDTLPLLKEKYVDTGRLRYVFQHLPLQSAHPFALRAAETAECAGREGQFWKMHDLLFDRPAALDENVMKNHVRSLKLNSVQFEKCMAGDAATTIQTSIAAARRLGIRSTPSFLVGRIQPDGRAKILQRLSGAQPMQEFEKALEQALTGDGPRSGAQE